MGDVLVGGRVISYTQPRVEWTAASQAFALTATFSKDFQTLGLTKLLIFPWIQLLKPRLRG